MKFTTRIIENANISLFFTIFQPAFTRRFDTIQSIAIKWPLNINSKYQFKKMTKVSYATEVCGAVSFVWIVSVMLFSARVDAGLELSAD